MAKKRSHDFRRGRRNELKRIRKEGRERKKQLREKDKARTQNVEPIGRLSLEYHTLSFMRLHLELKRKYGDEFPEPLVRREFWRVIPPGTYSPVDAQYYLQLYISRVEDRLRQLLQPQSIAYFLHVYRRLSLGPIGEDKSAATIANTRCILEAAIQKYARAELCNKLAPSNGINAEEVFAGEPSGRELDVIRAFLEGSASSLVLVDFRVEDLYRFYEIERMAYEVWRTAAMLRITGKGAPIIVSDDFPYVMDDRSEELSQLVERYDDDCRVPLFGVSQSRTGTVFSNATRDAAGFGAVLMPNVGGTNYWMAQLQSRDSSRRFSMAHPPNYLRVPFNFRAYLDVHRPLAKAFAEKYGFTLEECVAVFASLSLLPEYFSRVYPERMLRTEARGYEGAFPLEHYIDLVIQSLDEIEQLLKCKNKLDPDNVPTIISWLAWQEDQRVDIDLAYPGPHSIFLPVRTASDNRCTFFIDYLWIERRLTDLFIGVKVDDNNFKGAALESVVQAVDMPIHQYELHATDGTAKQVDASFGVGTRLFIVECRATSESIGFLRGQPEAIRQRTEKVERILTDVDAKARWLAARPIGRNYDISAFDEIVPIGVTPFTEFMPRLFERYWLRQGVPRVLTPDRLKDELENSTKATRYFHGVPVSRAQ